MTQLRDESSSESLSKASQPADETSTSATPGPSSTEATSGRPSGTLASTESKKRHIRSQRAPRRGVGLGPWIKAAVHTFIILFALYVWLSWTDPENVEMRRRAWEAAMKRLNKPPVVYANRYSPEFKYRPAASPIVTETLTDGRTRVRGARHGDNIPIPTPTEKAKKKGEKTRKRKSRKGRRH